ncbi:MAG: N-acetyltransferase [Caldilineaceae bacterium]
MVRLRQANLEDWPQLVALDQAIFGSYGAQEDPAIIRARLEVFPEGCVVLEDVLEEDELEGRPAPKLEASTILGYLTTEMWQNVREPALDEDPHLTHQPAGTVLNITTLAIAPNQQNRGLGAQLVQQALAIARRAQCTQIVLETAHAETFYRRHGFTKIGERRQRDIKLHVMGYVLNT